ncbi:MAG: sigma-70 family RNA polymerase sigma factor [Deltaproteobacteria bacterium]|nr:sigma-70 family RNA polymerase sigma factor [Deltaproteobacteria bacterium]
MTIFDGNRALLDAFRRGDRAALTDVYRHYVREVDALVRRGFYIAEKAVSVPGVQAIAEHREHVQEVFLRAFAEPARLAYDGLKLYRPYLLRIAKNLLIDRARKTDRHVLGRQDDAAISMNELTQDHGLGDDLDRDPEWQAAAAATKQFIQALPDGDRRYVELRFVERQSQTDAGEKLGMSRKQARKVEERIRDALKGYLTQRGLVEAA